MQSCTKALLFLSFLVVFSFLPPLVASQSSLAATTASLSLGRYFMGGTSVGGLIFFGGGCSGYPEANATNRVDIYSPKSTTWSTATLSNARCQLAATSLVTNRETGDGLAFFAGGLNPSGVGTAYNTVDIYDTSTGKWSSATLTTERNSPGATSVGGLALFAGGSDSTQMALSSVDIYNASSGRWSTASLSQASWIPLATSVGPYALFAAGSNASGNGPSNWVDIYDSSTNQWSNATLSVARWYAAATSLGDYAIFAGGSDDQGNISAQVDLFRGSTQQWSTATLSVPRWGLAAASLNSTQAALFGGDSGLAIFAGGFLDTFTTPPMNYSAVVDVFDPTSGTWFTTTLSQKRGDIASASLGDLAVFAGGWNPSADSRVVDIFVPSASPSPIYLVSNTSQLYYTPVLRLNSGSAQVILVPKGLLLPLLSSFFFLSTLLLPVVFMMQTIRGWSPSVLLVSLWNLY